MKRIWTISALIVMVLGLSLCSRAQTGYTAVTALVQDPNGNNYVNAPYNVSFVDPGTSGILPTLSNGSTFQKSYTGYATNSSGNLAITLPDNNVIASSSGATGTQWKFNICTNTGVSNPPICFNATLTISGATQDISAALKAVSAVIPSAGGGVGPHNLLSTTHPDTVPGPPALGSILCGNSTPAWAALAGPTGQNGIPYLLSSTPSGGNPQACGWSLAGVPGDARITTTETILYTDREQLVTGNNGSASAYSLPQCGSGLFVNNFNFALYNIGVGAITLTPTVSTINGQPSLLIPSHWIAYVYCPDNANYRAATVPDASAVPNTPALTALTYNTSTGIFGTIGVGGTAPPLFPDNIKTTSYTTVAGDFSSFNTIVFNSASAVTLTLLATAPVTSGQGIFVLNIGNGTVGINPNTNTINGSGAIAYLTAGQGMIITTDGTLYKAYPNPNTQFPFDKNEITFYDSFCAGTSGDGDIGQMLWRFNPSVNGANGAIVSAGAPTFPQLCVYQLQSAATASSSQRIFLGNSNVLGALGSNAPWKFLMHFQLLQTTNTRFYLGVMNGSGGTHQGDGFWLRYDTNATFADAAFKVEACSSTVCTVGGTTYTVDTNWHWIFIYSDTAGQVTFQLDNNTPQTISTHVTTVNNITFALESGNDTTASQSNTNVNRFGGKIYGAN